MFAHLCALSEGFEWSYGVKIILIAVTSVILFGVAVLLLLEVIGKRRLNTVVEEKIEVVDEIAVTEEPLAVVEEIVIHDVKEMPVEPVEIIPEPEKDAEIELTEDAVLVDDAENEDTGTVVIGHTQLRVRYNRSFTAKLIQAEDILKSRYSELKNELMRYGFKSRMSWSNESHYKGRVTYAKFAIRGKTLSLYLALDPEEFKDTKYFFENAGDVAKYEKVPMRLKLKSDRSVRWAKELIAILAEKNGLIRTDKAEKNFKPDYRPTSYLVIDKLIKLYYMGERVVLPDDNTYDKNKEIAGKTETAPVVAVVTETPVTYAVSEEFAPMPVEQSAAEAEIIDCEPVEEVAEEEIAEQPIEEEIIEPVPEQVEPVEETVEISEEVIEEIAEEVIEEAAVAEDIREEEPAEVIEEPAETEVEEESPVEEVVEAEEPVEEESVEVIEEPAETEVEEESPVEEVAEAEESVEELPVRDFEILEEVSVAEVEEVIGDEEAKQLIEEEIVDRKKHAKPKKFNKGIVNVDSLSRNFAAGEHVTLESLHERRLIAKKTNYFKVLADGKLDKPLIVEADDFSLEAAKMILITGGRVIKKKYE